jgi:hypothetical protein
MFEGGFEERFTSAVRAYELDAARFHAPTVEETLALGESAPISPDLVAQLWAIDTDALNADQAIAYSIAMQRIANAGSARVAAGVARTVATCPDDPRVPRELSAASQLGAALGLGTGAADALVAESLHLLEVLPEAHAMALAGNLSWRKASSLASNTLGMDPDAARRVAAKVLPKAWDRSPAAHDAAVRRAVDQLDPGHADHKRKDRERDIRLVRHHYGAGMGELYADMPSEDLDLIWTAADAYARRNKAAGDPRTLDRLRVDFLAHTARSYLTHGDPTHCTTHCDEEPDNEGPDTEEPDDGGTPVDDGGPDGQPSPPAAEEPTATPPTRHGRPVVLHVVWDLTSLLGLTDHCALLRDSATMLPPTAIRDLLRGGVRVRRMVIDPSTGEQLDLTPHTWQLPATDGHAHRQPVVLTVTTTARWDDLPDDIHTAVDSHESAAMLRELLDYPLTADDLDSQPEAAAPSAALAEYTASRAGHPVNPCAGPNAASAADLDHHQARNNGGKTIRTNLGPFVRRWHRIKTFTNWTVQQIQRHWEWTSPTGRRYTIEPHDYRLGP